MAKDIHEDENLADKNPEVVKRLLALAERAREDLGGGIGPAKANARRDGSKTRPLACLRNDPVFLLAALLPACSFAKRPNVLLIMADDVGIEGFGCYGGSSYRTPQIDKLAEEGLRFTHAYSQPLCTPTRVQIMTGRYNHRNWTYFGILDPKEKTFGHLMKEAGYKTCISGKWQLHSYDPPDFPNADRRRGKGMKVSQAGFDEHCLFHSWHTEKKGSRYAGPTYYKNGKLITDDKDKYGPGVSVDFILDFMKRNRSEPMFVYYPMALPHRPMVPTPDSKEWKDPDRREEENLRCFADMVAYMDKMVGRLIKGLIDLGLREDTLVLFYSDNGTHLKVSSVLNGKQVQGGKPPPNRPAYAFPSLPVGLGASKPAGRPLTWWTHPISFPPSLSWRR